MMYLKLNLWNFVEKKMIYESWEWFPGERKENIYWLFWMILFLIYDVFYEKYRYVLVQSDAIRKKCHGFFFNRKRKLKKRNHSIFISLF